MSQIYGQPPLFTLIYTKRILLSTAPFNKKLQSNQYCFLQHSVASIRLQHYKKKNAHQSLPMTNKFQLKYLYSLLSMTSSFRCTFFGFNRFNSCVISCFFWRCLRFICIFSTQQIQVRLKLNHSQTN